MGFTSLDEFKHWVGVPHLNVYPTGLATVSKQCVSVEGLPLAVEIDEDDLSIRLRQDVNGSRKLNGKIHTTFYIPRALAVRWGAVKGEPLVIPLTRDEAGWWVGKVNG